MKTYKICYSVGNLTGVFAIENADSLTDLQNKFK